jgi:hypothetical protein
MGRESVKGAGVSAARKPVTARRVKAAPKARRVKDVVFIVVDFLSVFAVGTSPGGEVARPPATALSLTAGKIVGRLTRMR